MNPDTVPVRWHISSHSPNAGKSCVVAGPFADGSGYAVLDSTQRQLGFLTLDQAAWLHLVQLASTTD